MPNISHIPGELTKKIKLVSLPPDAAGKKLTTKIPVITKNSTLAAVHELLIKKGRSYKTLNYVYVVSERGRLHGVFSVKEIFQKNPEKKVSEVMINKLIKALPSTDQEKVAHLALKAGVKAVPIVDERGYLMGVVDADEIQKILDHESKEDLLRLTGIIGTHDESATASITHSVKNRVPWIIIGLLGGFMTASIISGFQNVLQNNLVLASFIPLIAYIANAVANQTQTLFIRALATDTDISFKNYLVKQLSVTFLIALICWLLILVITKIFWGSFILGVIVGTAMSLAIITSTILALLIPQIMKRFNFDPAVGSGPFATVIQDFLSVTIYFTVASMLL